MQQLGECFRVGFALQYSKATSAGSKRDPIAPPSGSGIILGGRPVFCLTHVREVKKNRPVLMCSIIA